MVQIDDLNIPNVQTQYMTMQPIGLAVALVSLGTFAIIGGMVSIIGGVLADDFLRFETSTEMFWIGMFGVVIGKFGIDFVMWIPNLEGGFVAWVLFGAAMSFLIVLVIGALLIPLSVIDIALGGESMMFESQPE